MYFEYLIYVQTIPHPTTGEAILLVPVSDPVSDIEPVSDPTDEVRALIKEVPELGIALKKQNAMRTLLKEINEKYPEIFQIVMSLIGLGVVDGVKGLLEGFLEKTVKKPQGMDWEQWEDEWSETYEYYFERDTFNNNVNRRPGLGQGGGDLVRRTRADLFLSPFPFIRTVSPQIHLLANVGARRFIPMIRQVFKPPPIDSVLFELRLLSDAGVLPIPGLTGSTSDDYLQGFKKGLSAVPPSQLGVIGLIPDIIAAVNTVVEYTPDPFLLPMKAPGWLAAGLQAFAALSSGGSRNPTSPMLLAATHVPMNSLEKSRRKSRK
tara:strand:- start:5 stop:964 length:960 start_codon:yes stop_codon:yes gene_type:complete